MWLVIVVVWVEEVECFVIVVELWGEGMEDELIGEEKNVMCVFIMDECFDVFWWV